MNHLTIGKELSLNGNLFKSMLTGIPKERYLWKPEPEKWCLLEIICHLYDEEKEDFRTRIRLIFENPECDFPPIDPAGWVTSHDYIHQDYEGMIDQFWQERQHSVLWLKSLEREDWQKSGKHPHYGFMTAQELSCNWLGHDYLHIRQVTRLKYDHLRELNKTSLDYAGNWI